MSEKRGQKLPYHISQNFLTSKTIIRRLIRIAGITKNDTVLEIGAGKGHITKILAEVCGRVVAYEIDPHLCERLKPDLPNNVRLHCGDFLRSRLPKAPYTVFANIPFSITTDIVRKLVRAELPPDAMWLMMEKGAAKRFCGSPKETLASLQIKPIYETRIVWHFRREDFHPAPGVDVVMVEFRKKPVPDISRGEFAAWESFLRHSLQYGLTGGKALLTKKQAATALKKEGLHPLTPSGEMLYVQWLCLFRCWMKFGKRR